jgi:hypothetical protein
MMSAFGSADAQLICESASPKRAQLDGLNPSLRAFELVPSGSLPSHHCMSTHLDLCQPHLWYFTINRLRTFVWSLVHGAGGHWQIAEMHTWYLMLALRVYARREHRPQKMHNRPPCRNICTNRSIFRVLLRLRLVTV